MNPPTLAALSFFDRDGFGGAGRQEQDRRDQGPREGWEYHADDGGAGDPLVLDMDRFSINYEVAGVGFVWT